MKISFATKQIDNNFFIISGSNSEGYSCSTSSIIMLIDWAKFCMKQTHVGDELSLLSRVKISFTKIISFSFKISLTKADDQSPSKDFELILGVRTSQTHK